MASELDSSAVAPELAIERMLAAPLSQAVVALNSIDASRATKVALEERIRRWSAAPYRDGLQAVLLSLALSRVAPGSPFLEEREALLTEALRAVGSDAESRPLVERLREVLRELPEARREALVFCERATDAQVHGRLLWLFAGTCPTPRVIQTCVAEAVGWRRTEFERSPSRREVVEECFALLGPAAAPALELAALGPGHRVPQRAILARALAANAAPTSVLALAELLDDPATTAAARQGLQSLGVEVVVRALQAAPERVRKKAEAALAKLAPRARDVPQPGAPVAAALARVREGIPPELEAELWARLDVEHHDAPEVLDRAEAEVRRDVRALVLLADRFRAALARGEGNLDGLDLEFFLTAAREQGDPAVPHVIVELLAACPERGPLRRKAALVRAGEVLGAALGPPLVRAFSSGTPQTRKQDLEWLIEHAPEAGIPAFVAAASDRLRGHRDLAAQGLARAGPAMLAEARRLLHGSPDAREVAAEALRAVPAAESVASLEAALKTETRAQTRALLQGALGACKLASGSGPSASALDASLAKRAPAEAPTIRQAKPPRWRGGKALSAGALRWLLGALEAEAAGPPDAELRAVRERLDDEGCAALSEAISSSFEAGAMPPWGLTQVAVLGSEAQLEALGGSLGERAQAHRAAQASHGVEALRRKGSAACVRWLDHWSRHGTARLRQESQEALVALASARGLDREVLVDRAVVERSPFLERLEIAFLVGRQWSASDFAALFLEGASARKAASGLVFAPAKGEPLVLHPKRGLLDLRGRAAPVPKEGLRLVHPIEHSEREVARWAKAIEAMKLAPPFEQLRRRYPRPASKAMEEMLKRAELPTRALLDGLQQLGYRRGEPGAAGLVFDAHRELGRSRLVLEHDGFAIADGRNPLGALSHIRALRVEGPELTSERLQAEAARDLERLLGS